MLCARPQPYFGSSLNNAQPIGDETLTERWILHRLDHAIDAVNKGMEARHFMNATAACYDFWLYELCDVYIVHHLFGLIASSF